MPKVAKVKSRTQRQTVICDRVHYHAVIKQNTDEHKKSEMKQSGS